MSRKMLVFISLVLLVITSLANLGVAQASSYSGTLTITCTHAYDWTGLVTLDRDNATGGNENYRILAVDGGGRVLSDFYSTLPLGSYLFGDLVYASAPQFNPITVSFISLAGNGYSQQLVFSQSGTCAGLPTSETPAAVPGCDVLMPLPSTAVQGQMLVDTPAYWAPGNLVSPEVILAQGKTYFVLGEDSTGQYREILLSCTFLWVPKASIGPNPEAPWNGAPLPTTVVN